MKKWISLILAVLMALTLTACDGGKAPVGSARQEDGQNPVMNYVGTYGSGRATVLVEASEADSAKITVSWSSSAAERSEWVMSGRFDPETLTMVYQDCVKTDVVLNEDGSVASNIVVYENGTGRIVFSQTGASLTWEDEMEHVADGMVFAGGAAVSSGADYSGVTAMPADEVEQFVALVKDAYLNEDWDWLAEHVRYPITVDGEELADAQTLIAFLSERHVHPSDQAAMEEETCSGLFANGQGICLGSGQIWLLDPSYASDAETALEIIAISGVIKDS